MSDDIGGGAGRKRAGCFLWWLVALVIVALVGLLISLYGEEIAKALGWDPLGLISPFFKPFAL